MNWASFKLGAPIGALGSLVAISAFILSQGDSFNIFELNQLAKMTSLAVGGFITTIVPYLIGLKTTTPWDGKDRRTGTTGQIPKVEV